MATPEPVVTVVARRSLADSVVTLALTGGLLLLATRLLVVEQRLARLEEDEEVDYVPPRAAPRTPTAPPSQKDLPTEFRFRPLRASKTTAEVGAELAELEEVDDPEPEPEDEPEAELEEVDEPEPEPEPEPETDDEEAPARSSE